MSAPVPVPDLSPCPLTSEVHNNEPCTLTLNHWGGCTWEPEDAWRAITDPCPSCGKPNELEVRQDIAGRGFRSTYRCHNCGASGAAQPAGG